MLLLTNVENNWPTEFSRGLSHRGFSLFWTGWLPQQTSTAFYGCWRAWPLDEAEHVPSDELRVFYAAMPGGEGLGVGDCSIHLAPGQLHVTRHTAPQEREKIAQDGLARIKQAIDEESGARI